MDLGEVGWGAVDWIGLAQVLVLPKRRLAFNGLRGIVSHKTQFFLVTAVRTNSYANYSFSQRISFLYALPANSSFAGKEVLTRPVSDRPTLFLVCVISSSLKMETARSCETLVYNRATCHKC
jgi:hypothetical protein